MYSWINIQALIVSNQHGVEEGRMLGRSNRISDAARPLHHIRRCGRVRQDSRFRRWEFEPISASSSLLSYECFCRPYNKEATRYLFLTCVHTRSVRQRSPHDPKSRCANMTKPPGCTAHVMHRKLPAGGISGTKGALRETQREYVQRLSTGESVPR